MTSVERVGAYGDINTEAARTTAPDQALPKPWPADGAVEFRDVTMRYESRCVLVVCGPTPGLTCCPALCVCHRYAEGGKAALRNLTFSLKAREKVALVGRTGAVRCARLWHAPTLPALHLRLTPMAMPHTLAPRVLSLLQGKSSVGIALFRIVELDGGRVLIDGRDARHIGLDDLRSAVAVIPQVPHCCAGMAPATPPAAARRLTQSPSPSPVRLHRRSLCCSTARCGRTWTRSTTTRTRSCGRCDRATCDATAALCVVHRRSLTHRRVPCHHHAAQALERAHMKATVEAFPDGMQFAVAENGQNFSVGERQLLW